MAGDLGLSPEHGSFTYSVSSYSLEGDGSDAFTGAARYSPWARAIEDGQWAEVPVPGRKTPATEVTAAIDPEQWAAQRPARADGRGAGQQVRRRRGPADRRQVALNQIEQTTAASAVCGNRA